MKRFTKQKLKRNERITYTFGPKLLLDEIVLHGIKSIHMERMSTGHMWMNVYKRDGQVFTVNLWLQKRTIVGRVERE
jgi:hypothetical protein